MSDQTTAHDPGGKTKLAMIAGVDGKAEFSPCGRYRYWLSRDWSMRRFSDGRAPYALWIGMNPSVAAADVDDPTIRREMAFTKVMGIDVYVKCNIMDYRATDPTAHEVMRRIVDEYGHRARQAERQEGVDWKALSHAVRVGSQAVELLQTGSVTFPRPDAPHLIAIKLGQLAYREVAAEIEELLIDVEREAERSTLPELADQEWIDDFVADIYGHAIKRRI
ncbi:MAG TPA: DUF1643 domain-containing protein [Stellaceae bacterium]|jgi:hypothetical protein|nr:DUF1643 domain-containing protein [Stellaceae bacterium]